MYVGTHNNSYYNSVFGARPSAGSVYSSYSAGKSRAADAYKVFGRLYSSSDVSSSALSYVKNIKSGAQGINKAVSALGVSSLHASQGLRSSDPESLAVSSAANADSTKAAASVSIERVATGQENIGTALSSKALAGGGGTQQFAIEVGDKLHRFSVDISSGDTNETMQTKLAGAINALGIGVTASVSKDSARGTSTLTLSGDVSKAGSTGTFKLADTSGTALMRAGVTQQTKAAQSALYSVDGAQKTSSSNVVDLGGGVTGTLKKATTQALSLSRGLDASGSISKVRDLANSYNALYSAALENTDDTKANALFSKMVGASRVYAGTLSQLGINFDDSGRMTLDETKLQQSADSGALAAFFTENRGTNFGYTNQLKRIADDVTNNTQRYASASSFTAGGTSSAGTLGDIRAGSVNYLAESLMGGASPSGWLFDFAL